MRTKSCRLLILVCRLTASCQNAEYSQTLRAKAKSAELAASSTGITKSIGAIFFLLKRVWIFDALGNNFIYQNLIILRTKQDMSRYLFFNF